MAPVQKSSHAEEGKEKSDMTDEIDDEARGIGNSFVVLEEGMRLSSVSLSSRSSPSSFHSSRPTRGRRGHVCTVLTDSAFPKA